MIFSKYSTFILNYKKNDWKITADIYLFKKTNTIPTNKIIIFYFVIKIDFSSKKRD